MSTTTNRVFAFASLAALCLLQTSPAFAQFTGAGTAATGWLVQLLTPLLPIACIGVACLCFMGRINWAWMGAAMVGTAFFFGRDQIVSMFRGWLGV